MKKITFPLKPQMKQPEIADLHAALSLMGFEIAGAEVTNNRYGQSTRNAIRQFQSRQEIPATGIVDEATASRMNTILVERGVLDAGSQTGSGNGQGSTSTTTTTVPPDAEKLFIVEGEVVQVDGTPLQRYPVRAFDRSLTTWSQINDTAVLTDTSGRYRISYDPAKLNGKTQADLKVEVYQPAENSNGNSKVVASSPLVLQARPKETLDFVVGKVAYRGPDEYSRLRKALTPKLSPINDLNSLEVADVVILARDTRLSKPSVGRYIRAQRWSAQLALPAELFFALLQQRQPARLDSLMSRPFSELWATLEKAKAQNVISLPLNEELRSRFNQAQQQYLANAEHPYSKLLGTTSLKPEQQSKFTRRLTAGVQTGDSFWESLQKDDGFTEAQISELKDTLSVQAFASNNASLAVQLRGPMKVRVPRDVAAFSLEEWRSKILVDTAVQIPADFLPEKKANLRREAYARAMDQKAQLSFPTPALIAQMGRNQFWAKQPVFTFLKSNPEFEFDKQRITDFLKEHPDAVKGFPDANTARRDLLRLEQLFHITPHIDRLEALQALWESGLSSAPRIAAAGQRGLSRRIGKRVTKPVVNAIYRKAVHVTSMALNFYMRFHPQLNRLSLPAMRTPQLPKRPAAPPVSTDIKNSSPELASKGQALAAAATDLPEWTELFGSADNCACLHCESTLGPTAYLVDMMDFMTHANDGNNKTGLDYLLERRPDLGLLQLTCSNTETEIKKIDLVLEIMEQIVAFSTDGTTIPTANVGQTTWDSELLAATPENFTPEAYEKLKTAFFPFNVLPFNLWIEEGRRYLQQMGVARDELMRVMPPRREVGPTEIAAEALKISKAEQDLITKPEKTRLHVFWGVANAGSLVKQLRNVKTLLDKARIDYDTLLQLLNTRHLNPGDAITVAFDGEPCSLEHAQLNGPGKTPTNDEGFLSFLDRLHRFLRLQRKLGWTAYELDLVIQALRVKDFDESDFLDRLAAIQSLHETLQLTVSELATWWANLDVDRFEDDLPSQYEEIFLNLSVFPTTHSGTGVDLRNKVFALTTDRRDLVVTQSTDPNISHWLAQTDGAPSPTFSLQQEYSAYIQSAARVTADDLLTLVMEVLPKDTATGHVALNLANVSLLYRIGSFTAAMGITVKDYLRLVKLTQIVPVLSPGRPATQVNTQDFKIRFDEINQGDLSLEQLVYLLLHESEAASILSPKPEDTDALMAQLNPAFAGVKDPLANPDLTASLTQSLSSSAGLDAELLNELLFTLHKDLGRDLLANLIVAANPALTTLPVPTRTFHEVYETLHKFGLAWNAFGFDASHLSFVLDKDLDFPDMAALSLTEKSSINFEPWRRLTRIANLQRDVFSVENSVFALSETLPTISREEFLALASDWTGWNLADLTYLTGPAGFNYAYPTAFQKPDWLLVIKDAFALLVPMAASAQQAHSWTISVLTSTESESIKQVLTLAYDRDRWLEVMTSIQDELRLLKRDALLGYMLKQLGSTNSDDFYRHYLIDPEISSCTLTSRIVEAQATVQLFAQRILLNLEQPLTFGVADAEALKWRKNYRVWEAARKVFLYPENWMEPELRDDKTTFFKELEDGLMQDDVTTASAARLYSDYLSKLDQVSRVEIMGMYEDKWMDGETQRTVLHVIGRTRDISGQYYYRRWEDQKRWSSWERVDLDIEGDHVIPVVYNGKLYLFWPDFKQTQVAVRVFSSNSTSSDIEALKDDISDLQVERRRVADSLLTDFGFSPVTEALANSTLDNPNTGPKLDEGLRSLLESWLSYNSQIVAKNGQLDDLEAQLEREEANLPDIYEIELGMCWSQYQSGTWSRKMMTAERRTYGTNFSMSKHFFSGWVSDDNRLCIAVHTVTGERTAAGDGPVEGYVGYFYLDDSHANVVFSMADTPCPQGQVYLYGSYQSCQHWDSFISEDVSLDVTENGQTTNRSLLEKVSIGSVDVNFAHQYGLGGSVDSPFFINDISRTYFVRQDNGIASQINVHNFDLELETFTPESVSGKEIDTRKALLRASSNKSGGVNGDLIDAGIVAQPDTFASGHYGGFSDSIISHSNGTAFTAITANQVDILDALVSTDPPPQYIPQGYVVASTENQQLAPHYVFTRFYHPYTGLFTRQLGRRGVDGLLNPDPEWDEDSENLYRQLTPLERFDFDKTYSPNLGRVSQNFSAEYVDERIDFDHDSPYGVYNWELFLHIPLLIATRLMQNQRFAEARTWFQYIFDPTYSEGASPARYWKVKPLYEEQLKGPAETLQEMIDLLEQGDQTMEEQVEVFESEPFQPFAIARLRPVAYMQTTVMKFLDCLIAEADSLFKMDTRESIAEAAQLYMLAAEILGEKPTLLPAQETVAKTPNQLLARFKIDIDIDLSDPLDLLTSMFPNNLTGASSSRTNSLIGTDISIHAQGSLSNYNTLLAFAIPHNEKLYGYWDTLADRLFKIRNCMNISGQVRDLALFAPPIDPALLVRAAQAGLDIASVISNLYAPLPKYRFTFMLQKALEFSNEVRNLGSALQAAIEKQDAEELLLLTSTHEVALLEAITEVKTKNLEEAETSLETVNKNRESAELRHEFYSSRQRVSSGEQTSLDLQEKGRGWQIGAEAAETTGSVIALVPNMTGTAAFPPAVSSTFGGANLAAAAQATAGFLRARSASFAYQSNKAGTMAGYVRREDDWQLQADLALKEIEQLDKQILAAEIRKQITERDLENHKQQIAQSEEVEEFLKLKFSNEQLYSWMVTKLSGLYLQAYQLAYQIARQAEKGFQHELGPNEKSQSYIQPTYWDSLKKGLLAGEQLALDLRRLELAHLEANQRELEIIKHISLFQLDPAALLDLRQTGACEFDVPEVLFDMDFPGQHYRRIKSVRITVPCVVGPYTNVTGTLSLKSSRVRSDTTYPLPVLSPEQTVLPQTAIATSSVREDSGVFEFSFSDQRYLPFEGAGAVSGWSFELPAVVRQFDYDTIADVILHIHYTARDGGPQFKEHINTELSNLKTAMQNSGLGLSRLFSLRKEFSAEWNRLLYPVNGDPQRTTLSLSKQHFPRYLNYLWEQDGDNWEPQSIDLRITSVRATLDPQGPLNSADETVRLSAGLSGTTVTNESGVELNLTVTSGEMTAEKWKDVYVLVNYEVAV